MLIGLMGIVFGLGIMYLLSRVMQTSRRIAVLERQAKQSQMKVEDVDMQVNYLMLAGQKPPTPTPPIVTPVVPPTPVVNVKPRSPVPGPQPIPFPANMTLVDVSPEILMPPGLMNLFCGMIEELDDAAPKCCVEVEEVVESVEPPVEPPAKKDDPKEKEEKAFIDSESEEQEPEAKETPAVAATTRRSTGGRGGGRGRGKKA